MLLKEGPGATRQSCWFLVRSGLGDYLGRTAAGTLTARR
jgi:hypothetical protein